MIVLGVDPSSTHCGLVELAGDQITDRAIWIPPKRANVFAKLVDYESSLDSWIGGRAIDIAGVEQLAVFRGGDVNRMLAGFEYVTYLVLARRGIPIVPIKAGVARNYVLGLDPKCGKEEAQAEVRRRWPELKWGRDAEHKIDAFVIAKAVPEVLRRQKL